MKTTRNTSSRIYWKRRWQTGKRAFIAPSGIVVFIVILFGIMGGQKSFGQGVGISETIAITPDGSSILELRSSLRGFLAPRMTTSERMFISSPAQGLLVYDTDIKAFFYYVNSSWKAIAGTGLGSSNQLLGMNAAGTANEYKTLIDGLNISITHAIGSITINTVSSPTYSSLTLTNPLTVPNGGTGLQYGISGGIPYFSSNTTMASSALLTANGVVIGGGGVTAPSTIGVGAANTVLRGTGGAPVFGQIVNADITNTTIDLTTKVTGILPLANGGTSANLSASNGGIVYSNATQMQILSGTSTANRMLVSGSSTTPSWSTYTMPSSFLGGGELMYATSATAVSNLAAGTSGTYLRSNGTGAPTWQKIDLSSSGEVANTLPVVNGGTGQSSPLIPGGVLYGYTATAAGVTAVGSPGQMLRSTGAGTPVWSFPTYPNSATLGKIMRGDGTNWIETTTTYPNSTAINQLLYSPSDNNIAGLATLNNGVLVTNSSGVPLWTNRTDFTSSALTSTHIYVGNTSNVATDVAMSGDATIINSGAVTVGRINGATVPLSGSLTTGNVLQVSSVSGLTYAPVNVGGGTDYVTGTLPVLNGGTGKSTLTTHGVVIGNGVLPVNTVTGLSGQVLQSRGAGTDPSYSTAIYPTGTTGKEILYSSADNNIIGLATLNNGVLVTDLAGIPLISTTLPAAVQGNITSLGTISSGTWNGSIIGLAYGGTNTNLTLGSPATGDLLYADSPTSFARLADIAMGNVLLSGGAGVAPSWGKVDLGTSLTGILPIANGGTNSNSALDGSSIIISDGTSIIQGEKGTTTTVLHGNGSGAPSYGQVVNNDIADGTIDLASKVVNELPVINGGTGLTTFGGNNTVLYTSTANNLTNVATSTAAGQFLQTTAAGDPPTWKTILDVANGGLGQSSPLVPGGVLYGSTAAAGGVTAAGLTGQMLRSTGAGTPIWSTPTYPNSATLGKIMRGDGTNWLETATTYPNSTTINQLLYSPSDNNIAGLSTLNNGVLVTDGSGVPAWANKTDFTSSSLTDGHIYVGNASNVATDVAMSGDATIINSGAVTVGRINGATVPLSGSLTTGNVLQVSSASGLTYAPVNVGGGTDYVTGTLPVFNGGTGLTTFGGNNTVLYTSTADNLTSVATSTAAGQILQTTTLGGVPSWKTVLDVANGGTNSGTALFNKRLMISSGGKIVESAELTDGQVIVGKTGDFPQQVLLSGDATVNNAGSLLISNNAITNSKLANNSVTYSKIQNLSTTSLLLGSSSTTTPVQEITLGSGLGMTGTTLFTTDLGGTVTSFSSGNLSPLFTTSVTNPTLTPALSFSLSNANAYTIFGNNTNASAAPAYFSPVLASALFAGQGTGSSVLHGNATGDPSWSQIVNGDVDAAAGIIDTKLAIISTPGKVANAATTASASNNPNSIVLRDGSGDFIAGNITGYLVGNISGTAANLSGSPALPDGTTATTQAAGDNSTKLATTAYADNISTTLGADKVPYTGATGNVDLNAMSLINNYFADLTDVTKRASLVLSGITTGTARTITVPNRNITLDNVTGTTTTTLSGLLKGDGINVSAATVKVDYAPATSGSAILKGDGLGGFSSAVAKTDYVPATTGSSLQKADGTGGLTVAVATDIPNIAESQVTNLVTDLSNRALTATTVNGHALSSNVVISASDITTGTLPHAQLPTLVSLDIPNNAANTSGTAANVTGTVAVGNGGTGLSSFGGTNTLLFTLTANNLSSFATANNGILVTSGGGVPSIGNTVGAALTMPSINLSATSNQLVLQGTAATGTLTWTPTTSGKTITFPDASGEVALKSAGANWKVDGNAGTSAGTDFIGTTDAQDLVFKANSVEVGRLETTGYLKMGDANTGTIRATKELVFREDGDDNGASILRLRNRNGENGAIFETVPASGENLVDFIFKTAGPIQRNIRFEARGSARTGSPSFHIGGATGLGVADPDNPTLSVGDNYSIFKNSVKIADATYTAPTALLHLAAGTATASTAPLKFTSGTFLTATEAGAVEFINDKYYATITTGAGTAAARKTIAFLESPQFLTPNIDVATGTSLVLSSDITANHLVGTGTAPTDAAWGTGASPTPSGQSVMGKDIGGSVSYTTGGGPPVQNSLVVKIQFGTAYSSIPSAIILTAGSDMAGQDLDRVYIRNVTVNNFEIWTSDTGLTGGSGVDYKFYFMVVE